MLKGEDIITMKGCSIEVCLLETLQKKILDNSVVG